MLIAIVIVSGCSDPGTVYVYGGSLSSKSSPTANFSPNRYSLSLVAAGDVDGDGRPDVFVLSDELTGLYFGIHDDPDASTGDHAGVVPLGDINADGHADFIVSTTDDRAVGSARFYAGSAHPFAQPGIALPESFESATPYDADGDGIADLVVVADQSDFVQQTMQCGVSVYRGGPSFDATAAPDSTVTLPTIGGATLTVQSAGDIDGDHREDLVVRGTCARAAFGKLAIYFGGVALSDPPSITLATGGFPVSAGDFDGDGFSDLAVTDYGADQATPTVPVYFGPDLAAPRFVIAGYLVDSDPVDINGDGHPDLIVGEASGNIAVYFGGPAMDATPDIELSRPDDHPVGSVAYLGNGQLMAAYSGFRYE